MLPPKIVCFPGVDTFNSVLLNLSQEQWNEMNHILTVMLSNLFEVASNF